MSTLQTEIAFADVAKRRAIDRVETAHDAWVQLAFDVLRTRLATHPEFTTDDLWRELPPVSEPRAMGAVMRKAASDGLIRPTGKWVLSTRAMCHRRPIRVWSGVA